MVYGLAVMALVAVVAVVVMAPLRAQAREPKDGLADRRAALEAARDAKYREIRDTELDFRMGKVSEADYKSADRELRSQAVEILAALDELNGSGPH